MRIWKENLYQIIEDKGTTVQKVSKDMGYAGTYLPSIFSKAGKGYAEFQKIQAVALCAILKCSEEELMAIPVSRKGKEMENQIIEYAFKGASKEQVKEFEDMVRDGFAMLHADLMELIKLWRPEKKEEAKYEIKDREQP